MKFPKDERATTIRKEWAADYRQKEELDLADGIKSGKIPSLGKKLNQTLIEIGDEAKYLKDLLEI